MSHPETVEPRKDTPSNLKNNPPALGDPPPARPQGNTAQGSQPQGQPNTKGI